MANLYWYGRILKALEAEANRSNKETKKALEEVYEEEADQIYHRILDTLDKIAADSADGNLYVNDLYRTDRYQRLLNYCEKHLRMLGRKQNKIIEDHLINQYERTQQIIDKYIPDSEKYFTEDTFLQTSAISAKDVVHHVWCLDGQEFSDRIWKDKSKLLQGVKKGIMDGVIQGKSPWEIAKTIRDYTGNTNFNCYRVARTETAHIQTKASVDRYTQYGFTTGTFLASPTCCHECQANNGKEYSLRQLESLLPVHPNCTCSFTLNTK